MEILKCYRVSAVYGEMFIVLFMSMGLVSFGTSLWLHHKFGSEKVFFALLWRDKCVK